MYLAEVEIKDTKESITSASYLDLLLSVVNFTLPFTTNEMISISTSQTFRPWVDIFHIRWPTAFLSLSLYDTLAPRTCMNVVVWWPCDFPVHCKLLKQGDIMECLKLSFRKFYGRYGNVILPLTNVKWHSDLWPITVTSQPIRISTIPWLWYRAWP